MAAPMEFSQDAVLSFMLEKGGKVRNHELVKYFKPFLTDIATRDDARHKFKEFVNTLANIRNEDGEKFLVLKKRYRIGEPSSPTSSYSSTSPMSSAPSTPLPTTAFPALYDPPQAPSPPRQPPPYRPPPPPGASHSPSPPMQMSPAKAPMSRSESRSSLPEGGADVADGRQKSPEADNLVSPNPPPVPPRRKNSDKHRQENKENVQGDTYKRTKTEVEKGKEENVAEAETEQKISVKERMQKFNRIASENDLQRIAVYKKREHRADKSQDDDDSSSVSSMNLDPKSREWLLRSAQNDYHALAKLAGENPRLVRMKDPSSTALHWASKHGNQDIIKLVAGTYGVKVNVRTGGHAFANRKNFLPRLPRLKVQAKKHHLQKCWSSSHVYGREYCSRSTLHGLQYVGERRSLLERSLWFLAFASAVYMAAVMIQRLWDKWGDSPVIVALDSESSPVWSIPFPSVTVCNTNRILKTAFNVSEATPRQLEIFNTVCQLNVANQSKHFNDIHEKQYLEFLEKNAQPCRSMLVLCELMKKPRNCEELFTNLITDEGLCCSFNLMPKDILFTNRNDSIVPELQWRGWTPENGYPEGGPATTPARSIGEGVNYGLVFVLDVHLDEYNNLCSHGDLGFKMSLHSPVETPLVSQVGVLIAPETKTAIAVKPRLMQATRGIRSIPPNKRLCYFSDERHLMFYRFYTQQNCQMECEANFTAILCGCVPLHLPKNATTPICSYSDEECSTSVREWMRQKSFVINQLERDVGNPRQVDCGCLPGCNELQYDHEMSDFKISHDFFVGRGVNNYTSSYISENLAVVQVFYKDRQFISYTRGEMFGLTEFLSNSGGVMSLFLGFSLLSGVEIVYFFTLRCFCNYRSRRLLVRPGSATDESSPNEIIVHPTSWAQTR